MCNTAVQNRLQAELDWQLGCLSFNYQQWLPVARLQATT